MTAKIIPLKMYSKFIVFDTLIPEQRVEFHSYKTLQIPALCK